ncbi:MAG: hypothetical protein ACU0BF_01755 [Paracoccaceae bacterium]
MHPDILSMLLPERGQPLTRSQLVAAIAARQSIDPAVVADVVTGRDDVLRAHPQDGDTVRIPVRGTIQ